MSDNTPKTCRPHRHRHNGQTSEPEHLPAPLHNDGNPDQSTDDPRDGDQTCHDVDETTGPNILYTIVGAYGNQGISHSTGFGTPVVFDPHPHTSTTFSVTTQYPSTSTQETDTYNLSSPLSYLTPQTLAGSAPNTWSGATSQPNLSGFAQHGPSTGDIPRYGSPELAVLNAEVQTPTARHGDDDRMCNRHDTNSGDSTWSTSVYQGSDVDVDNFEPQGVESSRRKGKNRAERSYAMQRFKEDAHAPWTDVWSTTRQQ